MAVEMAPVGYRPVVPEVDYEQEAQYNHKVTRILDVIRGTNTAARVLPLEYQNFRAEVQEEQNMVFAINDARTHETSHKVFSIIAVFFAVIMLGLVAGVITSLVIGLWPLAIFLLVVLIIFNSKVGASNFGSLPRNESSWQIVKAFQTVINGFRAPYDLIKSAFTRVERLETQLAHYHAEMTEEKHGRIRLARNAVIDSLKGGDGQQLLHKLLRLRRENTMIQRDYNDTLPDDVSRDAVYDLALHDLQELRGELPSS